MVSILIKVELGDGKRTIRKAERLYKSSLRTSEKNDYKHQNLFSMSRLQLGIIQVLQMKVSGRMSRRSEENVLFIEFLSRIQDILSFLIEKMRAE